MKERWGKVHKGKPEKKRRGGYKLYPQGERPIG